MGIRIGLGTIYRRSSITRFIKSRVEKRSVGGHRSISKLTPHTLLTFYEQGVLTKSETLLRIVSLVTARNVATTLELIPEEWHAEIRETVSTAPTDDWSSFRILQGGTFVNLSAAAFEKKNREWVDQYRTGVEAIRAYFADQPNP